MLKWCVYLVALLWLFLGGRNLFFTFVLLSVLVEVCLSVWTEQRQKCAQYLLGDGKGDEDCIGSHCKWRLSNITDGIDGCSYRALVMISNEIYFSYLLLICLCSLTCPIHEGRSFFLFASLVHPQPSEQSRRRSSSSKIIYWMNRAIYPPFFPLPAMRVGGNSDSHPSNSNQR